MEQEQLDENFQKENTQLLSYEDIDDPESFSDLDDCETDLLEETERALGYLQPPTVLGGQKYIPYVLPEGDESNLQKQKELEEQQNDGK